MRLINVHNLQIEDFSLKSIPPYAILSHTWDKRELRLQEWTSSLRRRLFRKYARKIINACSLARDHRLDYVWVDTCCIDKTSSAELSEAINSMYKWYQRASVCLVHLSDLSESADFSAAFPACHWLTRGWTLQELIAPQRVLFYDAGWKLRGSKLDHSALIARCTKIPAAVLRFEQKLEAYSVKTRLAWADARLTTKPEDAAYCLLGLFDVNLSPIYGEGENAFRRLQEEIRKLHLSTDVLSAGTDEQTNDKDRPKRFAITPNLLSINVPQKLITSYRSWQSYPANLVSTIHHDLNRASSVIDPYALVQSDADRSPDVQMIIGDLRDGQRSTFPLSLSCLSLTLARSSLS